jgi:hypothetical protein
MSSQRITARIVVRFFYVSLFFAIFFLIFLVTLPYSTYKTSLHRQITLSSSGSKFELRYPDCQAAPPELWSNSMSTSHVWQKVQSVQLTTFYNCLGMPIRLYVSRDEQLLFVRRTADRELLLGFAPSARKSSWSDLIDISKTAPQTILRLIGCCMQETESLEKETNLEIEKIATTKGIELLSY